MTRHLHIADRWIARNIGWLFPAIGAAAIVLACLAHMNDTPMMYSVTSAGRG